MMATYPPGRFGALELSGSEVTRFIEKPKGDGGRINGGFFVLDPCVLSYIDDDSTIWEQMPLASLAEEGELMAYEHDGFWQPMDSARQREARASLAVWGGSLEGLGLMVDHSFWRGKRVLLTGHTGFKGSWLSIWLQNMGCELHGFSLPPSTAPNMFGLLSVADEMNSKTGDIRDAAAVEKFVAEVEPEIVIHMAAQPLVRDSYCSPAYTFATNVTGTVNILEALRKQKSVRAFVNVTTDKCYENRDGSGVTERVIIWVVMILTAQAKLVPRL